MPIDLLQVSGVHAARGRAFAVCETRIRARPSADVQFRNVTLISLGRNTPITSSLR